MNSAHVITIQDGGLVPVLGHLAIIEKAAESHGWSARGRVRPLAGNATRWYSKGDQMFMVDYGVNSQVALAVDNNNDKVTGKDRVGQILKMIGATA